MLVHTGTDGLAGGLSQSWHNFLAGCLSLVSYRECSPLKQTFCHHLLTPMSFKTCIPLDILRNVSLQSQWGTVGLVTNIFEKIFCEENHT